MEKNAGLLIRGFTVDISRAAEDYIRRIPALKGLSSFTFDAPVTFFTGENGSGKSTLLEGLAEAAGFNPEGGTRNYNFSTYDARSPLADAIRLIRGIRRMEWGYFLRAESFFNVATNEEETARDGLTVSQEFHRMSHGESFLEAAQTNFRPNGLYLLDEPEAALSPQRQLTLLAEIHRYAGEGAQFIIVTHSPVLLALPGARILTFDGGPLRPCTYEETGSVRVMRMMLDNREALLRHLLSDETEQ